MIQHFGGKNVGVGLSILLFDGKITIFLKTLVVLPQRCFDSFDVSKTLALGSASNAL